MSRYCRFRGASSKSGFTCNPRVDRQAMINYYQTLRVIEPKFNTHPKTRPFRLTHTWERDEDDEVWSESLCVDIADIDTT